MAVIKPTLRDVSPNGDQSTIQVIWTPVTNADTCAPVEYPKSSDKSIAVSGVFGGATVALHGSNDDGTSFAALNSPNSVVIGLAAAGVKAVLENTQQVKPIATGGGGTQALIIAMLFHLSNPQRQ